MALVKALNGSVVDVPEHVLDAILAQGHELVDAPKSKAADKPSKK